jgi:hypothetical protein
MITYKMVIFNTYGIDKTVSITCENFQEAVSRVKVRYGKDWYVRSCEIVSLK